MPMPKTAIDQDNRLIAREDHIRLAGQLFGMQAVAKTARMQPLSYQQLGLSVLAADASHDFAAYFRGNSVCQ